MLSKNLPDMSDFNVRDVADIALQRTSGLAVFPVIGSISYRAWVAKSDFPVMLEARLRRKSILANAFNELQDEFAAVRERLKNHDVKRMMDIGCGHGLVDLLFYREYRCNIHLVDIELTEAKHHGFESQGAGYGSLQKAKAYLERNGVPASAIQTTNPRKNPLKDSGLDLIVSFISAGFHYPISEYVEFAKAALRPGGLLIFDMRNDSGQDDFFKAFPNYDVIARGSKHRRIAAVNA